MRSFIFLIICLTIFSCTEDKNYTDPSLIGRWYDYNNIYRFSDDHSYYILYERTGTAQHPVTADSVFGNYKIDKKRGNIIFYQEGYLPKNSSTVVFENLNATTWKYEINPDTLLTYTSHTTLGQLYRE